MSLANELKILYEDNQILVLNKPSGLVVNISKTSPQDTVQDYLYDYLKIPHNDITEFNQRTGLIHRIDKDTSGLLLVAKDQMAFENLTDQFKRRKVSKEYFAVVWGTIKDSLIEIDAPIKRDPNNRVKMAVHKDGRRALTKIELLKTLSIKDYDVSIVKAIPVSGRTHQIRVHMCALYHPVLGDSIYMSSKQFQQAREICDRLMLHAWKIEFNHPKTNIELKFEAPLPPLMQEMYSKS